MLFRNYILNLNCQKIKIVFILNRVYQYCCPAKLISDDTQTLINAKYQGGLWRVNETV